jgi:hypothetical protein
MAFTYLMHGVVCALPFLCEELGEPVRGLAADIEVVEGKVPRRLETAALHQPERDLSPDVVLFRGGNRSARFLAEKGERITFEKNPRCEDAIFLYHLLYAMMGEVLWQRGACVLHASSVISPEGAVLVTGPSGTGKSTTVARLLTDGWPLQTDDVSTIGPNADGLLEIHPGARVIHLDEGSSARLGLDTRGLMRRDWQRMKMAVPAPVANQRRSVPVTRIVFLQHAEEFSVRKVRGRDKIDLLLQAVYGPVFPEVVARLERLLSHVVREVDMIAVGRPPGRWTVDDVVEAIRHG